MPIHPFEPARGQLVWLTIESEALRGNLLGDPPRRRVALYLPQGYDEGDGDYPLLVCLAPFTSSGPRLLGWRSFTESVPQRIDRLVEAGAIGPVIVALPDCFTSLGGNQYVDSPAMGRWESFLLDEMIPRIEGRFRVRPGAASRAVFGRSSGGYGALVQAMRHGDRWAAVACHSGDIGFDVVYRPEFPRVLDRLARHEGRIESFLEHVRSAAKIGHDEMHVLMILAMAATYDPDTDAPFGIRLPVDRRTCRMIEERWQAWLRHDPLQMIEQPACQRSLGALSGLFIDCGSQDPYGLHYGARALADRLRQLAIEHSYEEFEDTHSGIDYRLDRSLPFLYRAIARR